MFVLALSPVPYCNWYATCYVEGVAINYFFSDIMVAFMFLRLFYIMRTILNFGEYSDAFSKMLCKSYGFESGLKFAIKCHYILKPEQTVITMFFLTVCVYAYIIRIFEMPYFRSKGHAVFDSYFNAIWFTVVTLTTIGYGDISPGTVPGQIVTIILALWGALLLSSLVVAISSVFDMNTNQKMAL